MNRNINTVKKRAKTTLGHMKKTEEHAEKFKKEWWQLIDRSSAPTYVFTLSSRLRSEIPPAKYDKIVKYKEATICTSDIYSTSPNITLSNLPKVNERYLSRLNFLFGKTFAESRENYKTMMDANKVLIMAYTHKIQKKGLNYSIIRFYTIAPEMEGTELPIIYKIDVLIKDSDPTFYGIKASALVGGCVDGICPLFQIDKFDSTKAKFYRYNSGFTSYEIERSDLDSSSAFKISEIDNITNLEDACNYAFNLFNVKSRILNPTEKIAEMIRALKKRVDVTAPITGGEIVATFVKNGIESNLGKERQMHYSVNEKTHSYRLKK